MRFKETQQFRLQGQRDFRDFIQKQGAPLRSFNQSGTAALRARVSTLLAAENFGFEHLSGNVWTIQRHVRRFGGLLTERQTVQKTGREIFARARLAQQQHRRVAVTRRLLQLQENFAHRR
jgi:hypothetical protein